ncbi:S1 family peptidase [Amycolatopsis jiangsuensis]|uniref:Secreted trypsin-like serine protease n=1 Tax=Amycolatopsis jiangsuensis TaxID=1181879 RepID=A0A840J4D5_9PSEU|nr:serine protease [Amycolatopsis jiangsuensis]MBB4688485.1 secreted trypsin-like serine protease [Amycolatopsis jiangsuensis]
MPKRLPALLSTLVAGLALSSGSAAAAPAVIGGTAADQPYPYVVSLHTSSGELFCAGSLIAPSWVVTAAHCLSPEKPATISLRVGTNDAGQGGETPKAAEFVLSPHFDAANQTGDLGLIRLAEPVRATPVAIGGTAAPGSDVRLLGWGQTCATPDCGPLATSLQQLDTKLVDGAKCTSAFDGTSELCTDSPGGKAGSCYGDSGGPELVRDGDRWVLAGLVSRPGNGSPTCATAPSIATSVVAYQPWIAEKTGS